MKGFLFVILMDFFALCFIEPIIFFKLGKFPQVIYIFYRWYTMISWGRSEFLPQFKCLLTCTFGVLAAFRFQDMEEKSESV